MVTQSVSALSINGKRLMASLQHLAQIGRLPTGGVQRLAFSRPDCQARSLVRRWMQEAGMAVRIDAAGNLIGRYPGQCSGAPALATGSHLDTVPNGGHYDGAYGVLAGIEVVRVLAEHGIHLDHPLEVIAFADEEGTMIGCKALAGQLLPDPEAYRSRDQEPIESCLERIGGDWAAIESARRSPDSLAAFVELHIEQGPVLTSMAQQIGVVTGIVGQRRYAITITGQTSHAGTTPMAHRRDALVAASQVVLAIHDLAQQPGDQVATVGRLQLQPNVPNSIPGQVTLSLDIRDLSNDRLDELMQQVQVALDAIATETGSEIHLRQQLRTDPAPAAVAIQDTIAQVCQELDLSYCSLPSRASHDAQEMARIAPMGMIFVPSEGGISHADTEYTRPEDCINGTTVLLQTLLRLDRACP